VLTPEECQQFIDITEKMGYEEAAVSTWGGMVKMPDWRNNERVMWQAPKDVWTPIWERIAPHVPNAVQLAGTHWTPYGLNERLRFYRCTSPTTQALQD
jgi:prolyl 4-hydroxylase